MKHVRWMLMLGVVSLSFLGALAAEDMQDAEERADPKKVVSLSGPHLPPGEAKARTAKGLLPEPKPTADGRKQLTGLPKADKPRFPITDRVWPDSPDKPHICLWKDDALGAYSITIDDNTAPDHPWWTEMGKKYGVRVTWCVITGMVTPTPSYRGTWDGWRELKKLGHDIQSHSVTHIVPSRGYKPDDPSADLDHEYSYSKQTIEKEIPGSKVMLIAYPGGKYQRTQNSREKAMKYYSFGRGGPQVNPANNINYASISTAGLPQLEKPAGGKGKQTFSWIKNITSRDAARPQFYRGWFVTNFHQCKGETRDHMVKVFEYLNANKKDIWFGLIREVGMYAMERDTAIIKDVAADEKQIAFTLTDDMHDELFDFPLTIKVRLPRGWAGCEAEQGEKPAVAVQIVEHDGVKFALVQVVPDAGRTVLTPSEAAAKK